MNKKNSVVLITGGASGYGQETALLIAKKDGKSLVLWDINEKKGRETVELIKEQGADVYFEKVDVRNSNEVKKAAQNVKETYGKVDSLINCAGVHQYITGTVVETPEEEYNKVMDTNVKGIYLTSKYILPLMEEGSAIVNIASAWGLVASNKVPIYCASKAAVIHLTKAMSIDHAEKKIRVNSICPGTSRTPMVEKIVDNNYTKFGFKSSEEMWESRRRAHPLGRVGTAKDISELLYFLISENSQWITGAAITIDGGFTTGKVFGS